MMRAERGGQLYWPIFGKLYIIYAQKQTFTATRLAKTWRKPSVLQGGISITPIPRNQQPREQK